MRFEVGEGYLLYRKKKEGLEGIEITVVVLT
jgi:hypothetical protein